MRCCSHPLEDLDETEEWRRNCYDAEPEKFGDEIDGVQRPREFRIKVLTSDDVLCKVLGCCLTVAVEDVVKARWDERSACELDGRNLHQRFVVAVGPPDGLAPYVRTLRTSRCDLCV